MNIFSVLNLDDVAGADIGAVAALYALGNIDHGKIILDSDSIRGAFALALHTADAAGFTYLVDRSALITAGAGNLNVLIVGNEPYDLLGAGIDTRAAADALFAVNLGNAVNDAHCAELAGVGTVTQADAGEAAVHIALAAEQHGRLAVLGSLVVEALNGVTLAAGAGHECDHFNSVAGGNTHDLADLSSRLRACRNALVYGSFTFGNRSGIAVTAGEAAAAAVGAGKALADSGLLGVYFDVEYLGRKRKDSAEDTAENAENDNSINYRFHIIVLLIKRSSCR